MEMCRQVKKAERRKFFEEVMNVERKKVRRERRLDEIVWNL